MKRMDTNGKAKRGLVGIGIIRAIGILVSVIAPLAVFAGQPNLPTPTNLTEFVNNMNTIFNVVLAFIGGWAFFGLLTGVIKYAGAGGDEERLTQAKQLIVYGLIGMFILFSFWGIARLISKTYLLVG